MIKVLKTNLNKAENLILSSNAVTVKEFQVHWNFLNSSYDIKIINKVHIT